MLSIDTWCCAATWSPLGSRPDQLPASAHIVDRYRFTLNSGPATGASFHSHKVPITVVSMCSNVCVQNRRIPCLHRSPTALAPWIIRWAAEASSDLLRRSARCTQCGGKGATVQLPGWGGLATPVRGWPDQAPIARSFGVLISSCLAKPPAIKPAPDPR